MFNTKLFSFQSSKPIFKCLLQTSAVRFTVWVTKDTLRMYSQDTWVLFVNVLMRCLFSGAEVLSSDY